MLKFFRKWGGFIGLALILTGIQFASAYRYNVLRGFLIIGSLLIVWYIIDTILTQKE